MKVVGHRARTGYRKRCPGGSDATARSSQWKEIEERGAEEGAADRRQLAEHTRTSTGRGQRRGGGGERGLHERRQGGEEEGEERGERGEEVGGAHERGLCPRLGVIEFPGPQLQLSHVPDLPGPAEPR